MERRVWAVECGWCFGVVRSVAPSHAPELRSDVAARPLFDCGVRQICLWCYHKLREAQDGGKCPQCRAPYTDEGAVMKEVDREA